MTFSWGGGQPRSVQIAQHFPYMVQIILLGGRVDDHIFYVSGSELVVWA